MRGWNSSGIFPVTPSHHQKDNVHRSEKSTETKITERKRINDDIIRAYKNIGDILGSILHSENKSMECDVLGAPLRTFVLPSDKELSPPPLNTIVIINETSINVYLCMQACILSCRQVNQFSLTFFSMERKVRKNEGGGEPKEKRGEIKKGKW